MTKTNRRIKVIEVSLGVFELQLDGRHVKYFASIELAHRYGVEMIKNEGR